MKDLSIYRDDFPILKRKIKNNDLIFFDNGATTTGRTFDSFSPFRISTTL